MHLTLLSTIHLGPGARNLARSLGMKPARHPGLCPLPGRGPPLTAVVRGLGPPGHPALAQRPSAASARAGAGYAEIWRRAFWRVKIVALGDWPSGAHAARDGGSIRHLGRRRLRHATGEPGAGAEDDQVAMPSTGSRGDEEGGVALRLGGSGDGRPTRIRRSSSSNSATRSRSTRQRHRSRGRARAGGSPVPARARYHSAQAVAGSSARYQAATVAPWCQRPSAGSGGS